MQAKAKLRFLRISPKKVRLVADLIRGQKVEAALTQLALLNKAAKKPLEKLLNSAIANAENNFQLKKDNLFIKEIRVDQGGVLKRWLPRAHGRATPIRKKMSHINLVLEEIVPTKQKKIKKKAKEEKPVKIVSPKEIKGKDLVKKGSGKDKEEVVSKEHTKEIDQEIQDVRLEGKHRHRQHEDKKAMKKDKGFMRKFFSRKAG